MTPVILASVLSSTIVLSTLNMFELTPHSYLLIATSACPLLTGLFWYVLELDG